MCVVEGALRKRMHPNLTGVACGNDITKEAKKRDEKAGTVVLYGNADDDGADAGISGGKQH